MKVTMKMLTKTVVQENVLAVTNWTKMTAIQNAGVAVQSPQVREFHSFNVNLSLPKTFSGRTTRDPCHSSTTTTEAHAMTCPTVKTCPKGYIYYDDPTDDKCPTCILDCKVTHCPPCDDLVYVPNGCPYCKRRPSKILTKLFWFS